VLTAALLYLPTALLAQFPTPSPWATCGTSCPSNAFALTGHSPVWIDDFVRPLREVLASLLYAAVAVVLVRRTLRAAALTRRVLAPVAAVAVYRTLGLAAYQALRAGGVESAAVDVVGWLYTLTLPLITVAFGAGLLSQRLFVADALERITLGLREHADAGALREALARALGDPSLRIVYWLPGEQGRWVDESGWPIKPPEAERGRAVTEITVDGRRLAAVSHDSGLDPILVRAAGAHALTTLENERLLGRLHTSLDELAGSRARIAAVADRERRKIERDLHDGAQQRLVALRIKMEMVAERLDEEAPESAADIRRLEGDVDSTIDEVRSFARGIYPPLLAERGLSEALRAAGRGSPIPTIVNAREIKRHRPEIEATVYFACMEALQNAVKHAVGATGVVITLSENPRLRFEVRDDGKGFVVPTAPNGNGLTNLRDRMAAVGGEVEVRSTIGEGTTVSGVVPVG
jgi:signal transduction histidine kinase